MAAFGAHHVAFLRADLQGLDLRAAWKQYLAFSAELTPDSRWLARWRAALWAQLLQRAEASLSDSADRALLQSVRQAVVVLRQPLAAPQPTDSAAERRPAGLEQTRPALPSLEAFIDASGLDPDTYTQAEWLALYRAQFGLEQATPALPATAWAADRETSSAAHARRRLSERLRALSTLEPLIARPAQPSDPLKLWLAPPTAARLEAMGWHSLACVAEAVRSRGAAWWRPVVGLGQVRAKALETWLADLHRQWRQAFPEAELDPRQRARRRWLPVTQVPSGPPGAGGLKRPGQAPRWPSLSEALPTTAQVDSGVPARMRAWLSEHLANGATARAYRKEAERLWWWCSQVSQRHLAALTVADLTAYRDFLTKPPADWIEPTPLPRTDPGWRPFRGPLDEASACHALRIVQAMLRAAFPEAPVAASQQSVDRPTRGRRAEQQPGHPHMPVAPVASALPGSTVASIEAVHAEAQREDAVGRRWRLLLTLQRSTGRSARAVLELRVTLVAGSPSGDGGTGYTVDPTRLARVTAQLSAPDGRVWRLDDALMAAIQHHHQDAGYPLAAGGSAPVLLSLRPAVRRWQVRDGDVRLEPWPRPRSPVAWSWPACRRSLHSLGLRDRTDRT